jgi:uncharacterized protein (TIGR04255 family)
MTERSAGLPDYRNPPIDEMAIGVQFPPIEDFHDAHAGLYWQKVRTDYPRVENQPRLEGAIESVDSSPLQPVQIQIPFGGPSQSRTWLISQSDDYLIQIQNTRFVQNWRKRGTEYPRFEEVWALFQDHYGKFKELLSSEGLAQPAVQQVEITYINWITELPPSLFLKSGTVASIAAYDRQIEPEDQSFSLRYRLDAGGEVIERLYAQCQQGVRPQEPDVKGYAFAIIYRAAKADGLADDQIDLYSGSGRVVTVNAFTDLTTSEAHEIWGRIA